MTMHRFRLIMLAVLLWPAASSRAADPFEPVRAQIRKGLVETGAPSIAVAVAKDGRIVWEEGFGWADREKRIAANEHTSGGRCRCGPQTRGAWRGPDGYVRGLVRCDSSAGPDERPPDREKY